MHIQQILEEKFERVLKELRDTGNMKSYSMRYLRDLSFNARCGVWARDTIRRCLDQLGIGVLPKLTNRQNDRVILFVKDSVEGQLLLGLECPRCKEPSSTRG